MKSFAVYTLSRGGGVPADAREALRGVLEIVRTDSAKGLVAFTQTERIGIEGETRACVEYKDAREGTRAYERAKVVVKGTALVHLVIEPCAPVRKKEEIKS